MTIRTLRKITKDLKPSDTLTVSLSKQPVWCIARRGKILKEVKAQLKWREGGRIRKITERERQQYEESKGATE